MVTPPTLTTMCGQAPAPKAPCAVTVTLAAPAANVWLVEMNPFDQMFHPPVMAPPVEWVIVSASYVVSADWMTPIASSSAAGGASRRQPPAAPIDAVNAAATPSARTQGLVIAAPPF